MSGVFITFNGFRAINNLSFRIGEVELRAVIGPIRYLRAMNTMAIVLVEQCFDFASDLVDRLVVLRCGEVMVKGAREELTRDLAQAGS